MLDFILRPIASRWASTFPDTSPLVANAAAAAPEQSLWAGPLLDGKALENELVSVLGWGSLFLLMLAAGILFTAYAAYRAKSGNPVVVSGYAPLTVPLFLGAVLTIGTAGSYATVDRDSGRAAVITHDRVLEYSNGKVSEMPSAQIRSVTICNDCSYVKVNLKDGRTITIHAEADKLESLRSAAGKVVNDKPA